MKTNLSVAKASPIAAVEYEDWIRSIKVRIQRALLKAMLQPNKALKAMQDAGEYTAQLVLQEEFKTYPVSDVWDEFCRRNKVVADESWLKQVQKYEKDVLLKRQ